MGLVLICCLKKKKNSSKIWQHCTYLIHCDFLHTEETQIWYMEGGRCQKSLNRMHEIWPCQQALFVHVNVTTRTAANETAVFETIFEYVALWFVGLYVYKCQCHVYAWKMLCNGTPVCTHAKIRLFHEWSYVMICHVLCNCLVQCSFSARKVLI